MDKHLDDDKPLVDAESDISGKKLEEIEKVMKKNKRIIINAVHLQGDKVDTILLEELDLAPYEEKEGGFMQNLPEIIEMVRVTGIQIEGIGMFQSAGETNPGAKIINNNIDGVIEFSPTGVGKKKMA